MTGLQSFTPGSPPTDRELELICALADADYLNQDLVAIISCLATYYKELSLASRSSTVFPSATD